MCEYVLRSHKTELIRANEMAAKQWPSILNDIIFETKYFMKSENQRKTKGWLPQASCNVSKVSLKMMFAVR